MTLVRTEIVNLEHEIGSLRQSGKTLTAELDRQAVESRETRAELGQTRERYIEQVARAASAESALRSLKWRVVANQGETAVSSVRRVRRRLASAGAEAALAASPAVPSTFGPAAAPDNDGLSARTAA